MMEFHWVTGVPLQNFFRHFWLSRRKDKLIKGKKNLFKLLYERYMKKSVPFPFLVLNKICKIDFLAGFRLCIHRMNFVFVRYPLFMHARPWSFFQSWFQSQITSPQQTSGSQHRSWFLFHSPQGSNLL